MSCSLVRWVRWVREIRWVRWYRGLWIGGSGQGEEADGDGGGAQADELSSVDAFGEHTTGEQDGAGRVEGDDHGDDGEVPDVAAEAEAASMARTISRILADPERYRQAARAAAGELSWQREEEAVLAVYRRLTV